MKKETPVRINIYTGENAVCIVATPIKCDLKRWKNS
jgi:hypothetical protein